jgi:VIT1/CCC1 family predicted Fe2+/Mn2+ transporter
MPDTPSHEPAPQDTLYLIRHWRKAEERALLLQVIQPGLIGLIDGTISTLAPIFATAYIANTRAAFFVGLAAALGAAISMGLSEGLSDTGELTGRGASFARGMITGVATFAGGTFHSLPFLISNRGTALGVAYVFVSCELILIAIVRKRFLMVPLLNSLIQVTLGGIIVAGVGVALGHA